MTEWAVERPPVICFSSVDWSLLWQAPHEIMAALAARGHRVLFVDNTGVRAPGWRDMGRLRHRLHTWRLGDRGVLPARANLTVYSPLLLPFPYSAIARRLNRIFLMRRLRAWLGRAPSVRPIVWTFLPTPLVQDLIRALQPALTVYSCVNDFAASSPAARRIAPSEARLFAEADVVFASSEALRLRAAAWSPHVHLMPPGVDIALFEAERRALTELPADLRTLRPPRVGYLGGVHRWLDQDLLAGLADRMPDVTFVLLGPVQTDVSQLHRRPNVRLIGARLHESVPGYLKGFAVGLVPYRLTPYTADVCPTKLNEYLAMGMPVVATDLPAIRRFNADHGPVVAVGGDLDAFAAALRVALRGSSPAEVERRIEAARCHRWDARITAMVSRIDERLRAAPRGPAPRDLVRDDAS